VGFLTTHRRELPFPIKGTLAPHCQVARLVSESFLMLIRIVSGSRPSATKFCVIRKGQLTSPDGSEEVPCLTFERNPRFTSRSSLPVAAE
jgi:hypothetical protein